MARFSLGLLQMAGAAFSLCMLIWKRVNSFTISSALMTSFFDLFEYFAFRNQINKFCVLSEERKEPVMKKIRVLFLCTANSCRSQMAEGFLRHMAGDRFEVTSAGTTPTELNPVAVRVMQEGGIDTSSHWAKDSAEFFRERFQYVITVCKKAKERCPIFPGAIWRFDWDIQDPDTAEGTAAERLGVFRQVRDEIEDHVRELIAKEA